jgi:thiamine-monophosphate kinase
LLVKQLGEEALIGQMREIFASTSGDVALGIGDDAAVVDAQAHMQMVWTTDLVLEGIHFERSWLRPRDLGRRTLAVSLSDLAAMGAEPAFALFSLACSGEEKVEVLLDVCQGVADMALESGTAVVGGDTSNSGAGLVLSVAAGGIVPEGRAVTRSGAAIGDTIYVTGLPGRAAAGFRLLKAGQGEESPALCRTFIAPEPRLEAGGMVAKAGASAMIDLSDGLARDLRHICAESGAGAEISIGQIPVDPELSRVSAAEGWNIEELILGGGEDYELLFTASSRTAAEIETYARETGLQLTAIGEIKGPESGVMIIDSDGVSRSLEIKGFDHFDEETG